MSRSRLRSKLMRERYRGESFIASKMGIPVKNIHRQDEMPKTLHRVTFSKNSFLETLFEESETNNAVKVGYFDSYKSNIFDHKMPDRYAKMFAAGDGNELFGKACAIHSSSMLAYNMFSWIDDEHPFIYNAVKYTNAFFEVHLPTLKGTKPANMDIVLEGTSSNGKRSILFIESKFTEYFSNDKAHMKNMGVTYNKPDRYFVNNGEEWAKLIECYREKARDGKNVGYYDGIKQVICHLIAISNLSTDAGIEEYNSLKGKYDCESPQISKDDDFIFINLLFKPSQQQFPEVSGTFDKYNYLFKVFRESYIDLISGRNIGMEMLTYGKLWEKIKEQMPHEQMDYVQKKYMKFSD